MKPDDMKGLKIRVPNSPMMQMFPKAVGANPTPIAFAEVYLALQQGVVDAEENPLPTIQAMKFYEVQSNINLTGHIGNSLIIVVVGHGHGADGRRRRHRPRRRSRRPRPAPPTRPTSRSRTWSSGSGTRASRSMSSTRPPFQEAMMPVVTDPEKVPYTIDQYKRLQALAK